MLHGFGALLFWDVRIGQGHGVIIFLVVHGGLGSCINVVPLHTSQGCFMFWIIILFVDGKL
jgi:hypothetical protein